MAARESPKVAISNRRFPEWVRWASLIWLAFWFVIYWRTWGLENFLHVCDIAVILTCAGLWTESSLLLSSQAVSSIGVDLLWDLDAAWRLLTGHHLTSGTEYMWDAKFPLWVRLISLFHVVWPILLLWSLKRVGYDRRGLPLQMGIAGGAIIAGRLAASSLNVNFAFTAPIFHRQLGPMPLHLAIIWAVLAGVVYVPTHVILAKIFLHAEGLKTNGATTQI